MQTRRHVMQGALAAGAGLALPRAGSAAENQASFVTMGYTLAIHVPSVVAMREILPTYNYAAPRVTGIEQIQTITQSLIAGSSEFGDSDFLSTVKAVQSGADLAIIGNAYVNTSLVLVVNSRKVKTLSDLLNPEVTVGVNGTGDGTFLSWAGALVQAGLDLRKLNTLQIGGSGARMRAMLAKRVDGTAMHFDQAEELKRAGAEVSILVEPWTVYHPWMNEVWVTKASTLSDPANQRRAVDVLKATLVAFRKANSDLGWYAERYRRYATLPHAKDTKDEEIRPIWETLRSKVGAWPDDMNFSVANAERLLPNLRAAGALPGPVDFGKLMRTEFLQQAIKELS